MANGIDVHGSLKIDIQIKKAKYIQKKGRGFHIFYLIGVLSLYRERKFVDD
jgi:hypothetical protein